jgi:hypothetical protein
MIDIVAFIPEEAIDLTCLDKTCCLASTCAVGSGTACSTQRCGRAAAAP